MTLKVDDKSVSTNAIFNENPLYEIRSGQYDEYDTIMTAMEQNLTEMHNKVNILYKAKTQLKEIVEMLKNDGKKGFSEIRQDIS